MVRLDKGKITRKRYDKATRKSLREFLKISAADQLASTHSCRLNVLKKALQLRVEDLGVDLKRISSEKRRMKKKHDGDRAIAFFKSPTFYWMCDWTGLRPRRIKDKLFEMFRIKGIFTEGEGFDVKTN